MLTVSQAVGPSVVQGSGSSPSAGGSHGSHSAPVQVTSAVALLTSSSPVGGVHRALRRRLESGLQVGRGFGSGDRGEVELVAQLAGEIAQDLRHLGARVEVAPDQRRGDRRAGFLVEVARGGAVHRLLERGGEPVESLGGVLHFHRLRRRRVDALAARGVRGVGRVGERGGSADVETRDRRATRGPRVGARRLECGGRGHVVGGDPDAQVRGAAAAGDGEVTDASRELPVAKRSRCEAERRGGHRAGLVGHGRACGLGVDVDRQRGRGGDADGEGVLAATPGRGLRPRSAEVPAGSSRRGPRPSRVMPRSPPVMS